ncbi:hypothetical protein [Streptomyces mirabilis]|uniref:hypothetical protein n=1 Tax=Streptomyces mirabilis TaxID=68239 RepID=UPI0033A4C24E
MARANRSRAAIRRALAAQLGRKDVAVDPARIRRRMQEAEGSNRRSLEVREARVALRALAVALDGGAREEPGHAGVALEQAS